MVKKYFIRKYKLNECLFSKKQFGFDSHLIIICYFLTVNQILKNKL